MNSLIFSFVGGRIGANFGKSVEAIDENIHRGKQIGIVVANTLALVTRRNLPHTRSGVTEAVYSESLESLIAR